jgi:peptide deformylase
MSAKQAIKLVKVGDPLLKITCNKVIFPLSDQIDNTIDECINSLRNIEGFWEGKAISVSAP